MITSTFGKLFLDAYNEKYATHYDAKTFFVEQYWPLFFDHNKYMMWPQNSPFVQMKKGQKVETLTADERKEKLHIFVDKVCQGAQDASVALGYAASEEKEFATTSGQVTSMQLVRDKADIYLSWIGASLAIGVKGGLSILFNNKDLLLNIFEGWKIYRDYLENNDLLKGNKISSWNGMWLTHRYNRLQYHEEAPMTNFSPFISKDNSMSVDLASWTKVLAAIARSYKEPKMLGYVFNFGKTNTTIGFIPFALEPIRRTAQIYGQLFGMDEYRQAEELFGTAIGLKDSCSLGAIGIKALEPKGLSGYIKKGTMPNGKDPKNEINIHTYITWILAMLNNQELWDEAQTFASALKAFSESGEKGRTDRLNKANNVLEATNKRYFIHNLTEVVKLDCNETFVNTAKLVNAMPSDNVPYFLTLIRFQYATNKNSNNI